MNLMTQEDGQGVGSIKKTTGFATNAQELAAALSRVCRGKHRHIQLIGGRAKRAEIYPPKLCKAIIQGLIKQMIQDGRIVAGQIGAIMKDDEEDYNYQQYWDELSGEPLDTEGVKNARKEEIQEFKRHNVYKKVPISR